MKIMGYQFLGILVFFKIFSICAQDAPVSTIGSIESTGLSVSIPITATGFIDIGSCNLQLLYDPAFIICTSVEKGIQLAGGLATNLEVPGVITIGWYTWPGVTLSDNSEVFVLNFSKVSEGNSVISWNSNYPDRQWSDGNSFTLNDQPYESFYHSGSLTFEEDAPVTTIPDLTSCSGISLDVPVTVLNFNTIGAISLTLQFDAEVLSYVAYTNNSDFPGLVVFSPGAGIITAAGFSTSSGITLPDNAILFTLHLTTNEGVSELFWVDDGVSCEYAGPPPTYIVLNDLPQESFYIDGNISVNVAPDITIQPVTPDTVIAGSGTAAFIVGASGNDLIYQWQEFIGSWNDLNDGGYFSGVFTTELSIVDPPITMNGNRYRCIVSNNCEPQAISDGLATLLVTDYSAIESNMHNEVIFISANPNPCRDETFISYRLLQAGDIYIEILDLSGTVKFSLDESKSTPGNYQSKINTNQLLPGLYLVRIRLNVNNNPVSSLVKIVKFE